MQLSFKSSSLCVMRGEFQHVPVSTVQCGLQCKVASGLVNSQLSKQHIDFSKQLFSDAFL